MEHICTSCGKSNAQYICSRCKTVRYCSIECQKKDWKSHKKICVPFVEKKVDDSATLPYPTSVKGISKEFKEYIELSFDNIIYVDEIKGFEKCGRGLIAKRDMKECEIVLTEEPIASVPAFEVLGQKVCVNCYCSCEPYCECKLCKYCFCSEKCYKEGAEYHKVLCKHYREMQKNPDVLAIQDMHKEHPEFALLAVYLYEEKRNEKVVPGRPSYKAFLDLNVFGPEKYESDPELKPAVDEKEKSNKYKDIIMVTAFRASTNINTIYTTVRGVSGYGVYLATSLINHSCFPNCAISYVGNKVRLTAIRPIKKGEMITMGYYSVARPDQPELFVEPLSFTCYCSFSIQHRKNEDEILQLIQRKRSSLRSDIINDCMYNHFFYYCPYCKDTKPRSDTVILHSSKKAYVCLQCYAVFDQNSSHYQHYQSCIAKIDGFLHKYGTFAHSLIETITIFTDPLLRQTIPINSHLWDLPFTLVCNSLPIFDDKTVQIFNEILQARLNNYQGFSSYACSADDIFCTSVKMIMKIWENRKGLSFTTGFLLSVNLKAIMKIWKETLHQFHMEDTLLKTPYDYFLSLAKKQKICAEE